MLFSQHINQPEVLATSHEALEFLCGDLTNTGSARFGIFDRRHVRMPIMRPIQQKNVTQHCISTGGR